MDLLYVLLILLAFARVAAEVADRLGQPSLVGELLAGLVLGMVVGYFSDMLPTLSELSENRPFQAIVNLGMFFLILLAGLELEPREIFEVSGKAMLIALGGFILPFIAAFLLTWHFLPDSEYRFAQAFFVGTGMAITALPVSVKVLFDTGQLHTEMGRLIVSAALFDDTLSFVFLAVLMAILATGEFPGILDMAFLVAKVVLFFAVTCGIGWFIYPNIRRLIERSQVSEFEFSMLLISAMAYAVFAEWLGLHFIMGAFIAGLFISHRTTSEEDLADVKQKVAGVTNGFFAPLFFASIGFNVQLQGLFHIPLYVFLLLIVAILGKVLGAGIPARSLGCSPMEATGLGLAMSGRGAVELVIASIAFQAGLFAMPEPTPPIVQHLFSATIIVAVVTTLLMPMSLRWALRRMPEPKG